MPNRVQKVFAQLKSRFNDVLFGADSGMGASTYTGRSGTSWWIPGTTTNWEAEVGDLWLVPVASACLNYEWRNLCLCKPQVTRPSEDEEKPINNHPLIELLKNPNPEYDLSVLLYGILLSWKFNGNAYLGIERTTPGGLPSQLWYVPHWMIKPKRDKKTLKKYYEYRVNAQIKRIEVDDIVHIRHGIDPTNPMLGIAPLASAPRDGYQLQQGANYGAKAMKNAGLLNLIATPKPDAAAAGVFDTQGFVDNMRDKSTGERAGEATAWDLPLDIQVLGITPQSMAIDTMLDRPEADFCALFGIPAQVVGIHVGRLSKTYANVQEAREITWEEEIVPTGNALYGQIGHQLLFQMRSDFQASRETCSMDISQIRPLQPDLDALYERADHAWELNLIDRYEWQQMVGRDPKPEDKDVYFSDVQVQQQAQVIDKQGEQQTSLIEKQGAVDKANQPKPLPSRNGSGKVLEGVG